jgi:hypothetical protein
LRVNSSVERPVVGSIGGAGIVGAGVNACIVGGVVGG